MAYLRAYQAAVGDPGFGGWLKKRLKVGKGTLASVVKVAGFIPGVGGIAAKAARFLPALKGATKIAGVGAAFTAGSAAVDRFLAGGAVPPGMGPVIAPAFGRETAREQGFGFRRSGKRMNVANVKALRRAIRRVDGFKTLACSAVRIGETVRRPARRKKGCKCR